MSKLRSRRGWEIFCVLAFGTTMVNTGCDNERGSEDGDGSGAGNTGSDCDCGEEESCVDKTCLPWECTPGENFCSGNTVRSCASHGLSSAEEEVCGDTQYCDVASVECKEGTCAPEQPTCVGNIVRFCNAEGTGYEPGGVSCGAGTSCEAGDCKPHLCTPGESFCQEQEIKLCAENGLHSTVEEICGEACLSSSSGASCVDEACLPGTARCSGNAVETCDANGEWGAVVPCGSGAPHCSDGVCGQPSSCQGLVANCGSSAESCCMSPLVTGGTYHRLNDALYPATVSDFRLDKYEVTVGRFRKFLTAWNGGWRPAAGAGKHIHLHGGNGLSNSEASTESYEEGWNTAWATHVDNLGMTGEDDFVTWTASAAGNENRPINNVNWYESYAFCIWDGGFLPSDPEWNYAAAGGSEQRTYPWGAEDPEEDALLAVYGCYYPNGSEGDCTGVMNIAPVGSAPLGNGRYGHSDLGGNVLEWVLDVASPSTTFTAPCSNCAYLSTASQRVIRGGAYRVDASYLRSTARNSGEALNYGSAAGMRCARTP